MIIEALLIAAAGAAVVGVVAFWDEIKTWLGEMLDKLKAFAHKVFVGAKIFIRKIKEGYYELVAEGYQHDKKMEWSKHTEVRTVSESEVPAEIRAKAKVMNEKVDISTDLEKELKMIL